MYSAFQSTRHVIRALLIATLLVFGHVFTLIASSRCIILQTPPEFEISIKHISALVAATILWLSFTLLELVDLVENPESAHGLELLDDGDDELQGKELASPSMARRKAEKVMFTEGCKDLCMFFCRTEVELGFGLALLAAWLAYRREALFVLFIPVRMGQRDLILLEGGYIMILLGLAVFSGQTLLSLTCHVISNGVATLRKDIWGSRTGAWTSGPAIRLGDECEGAVGGEGFEAV